MKKWLKMIWQYFSFWIKRDVIKKKYQTPREFHKAYKPKSKNDIIKEIVFLARKINKNKGGVTPGFKKELRSYSKKKLVNVLIYLKLQKQFGGK